MSERNIILAIQEANVEEERETAAINPPSPYAGGRHGQYIYCSNTVQVTLPRRRRHPRPWCLDTKSPDQVLLHQLHTTRRSVLSAFRDQRS